MSNPTSPSNAELPANSALATGDAVITGKQCVQHLVVDTATFIDNSAHLYSFAAALTTTVEVLAEIRSAQARHALQLMTADLHVRRPTDEAVTFGMCVPSGHYYIRVHTVREAASRTGDIRALSATDIQLLAVAVDMYREMPVSTGAPLRMPPAIPRVGTVTCAPPRRAPDRRAGDEAIGFVNARPFGMHAGEQISSDSNENIQLAVDLNSLNIKSDDTAASSDDDNDDETSSDTDYSSNDSDDDRGWITNGNVHQVQAAFGGAVECAETLPHTPLTLAVCTSDFAMQNVLLHMGIGVLSPTGTLVTRLRQYVHRCRVCFRCALDRITRAHKQLSVSRDMRAEFCGKCGHNQLDRVTALIDPVDSSVQLCLSRARFNKPPRRYPPELAPAQGGKHGRLVRTTEDARLPQNRVTRKQLTKVDPLDPDFATTHAHSPFAIHDVTSRSAMMGIRHQQSQHGTGTKTSHGRKRGGKRH